MDESVPRPVGVQKSSGAAFLQLSHKLFYIPCIKIAPTKNTSFYTDTDFCLDRVTLVSNVHV